MPGTQPPLLRFETITKMFGGTQALGNVSLDVRAGEILALLGENGAGKSTLIKCLAGIHTPDEGQILYRGSPYRHMPPRFGQRQPVAFIHQDLGLVEWMDIAENIALAIGYPRHNGLIDWDAAHATAVRALDLVGCDIDPSRRVQELSRTEKSLVAIARALAVECDVLVLDEPTASLPADEVTRLFDALRPLREKGVGMIYVSHRLDEVFALADHVAVLRDGQMVGMRAVGATTPDELVVMIVGQKPKALARSTGTDLKPLLEVQQLSVDGCPALSFEVKAGEIVGFAGLRGAGQEQVGRALFGAAEFEGSVMLDGSRPNLSSPQSAMAHGIGLIARDRTEESVATGLSVRENTFINPGATGRSLFAMLSPGREAQAASRIGAKVGLRPNDPYLPMEALSGGNQQKVIVGRWLDIGGRLLIAEDPTAGVDVGAKADIYALLEQALQNGLGVIVVSTDFEEVAKICHRVLVFSRGAIVSELSGEAISVEALIHAASVQQAEPLQECA